MIYEPPPSSPKHVYCWQTLPQPLALFWFVASGTVSSKYQLTLPTEIRKGLGIKPGDRVEYEVKGGRLEVRVIRPDLGKVLDEVLGEHGFEALRQQTQDDAVKYLREERGLED